MEVNSQGMCVAKTVHLMFLVMVKQILIIKIIMNNTEQKH